MAYNLGVARGVIELIYNSRGTDKAKEELDSTLRKTEKNKEAFNKVGQTAATAGLVMAAGLGAAVVAAGSFEKRMNAIKAVSGASAEEMDLLSKKALQLGQDTAFSANEAGLAIEELIKAGVSVPDVLNGAADAVVALAAAGEVALPEAASIASAAMNSFNLSAQDMPKVADLIAGAANASAIDVTEFGYSLKQVGAVAKLAGLNFADTATSIALMGQAGIKGSDAGTSLKTMLSNLIPTTDKQKELMYDLGLATREGGNAFFDAQGNMKPMAEIAGLLKNALKDMTKEQKLATLETLFGSDAIRAAATIADGGAEGFNKMASAMGKVKAADVAKTRMAGLAGEIEQLKGSAETLAIQLGGVLLPSITKLVQKLTAMVNAFGSLSPGMQKTIVMSAAIAAGLLLMVAVAAKVASAYLTLTAALAAFKATALGAAIASKVAAVAKGVWAAATWLLNAALAVLTSPITLIIAGIALLVAAIILLWKKNETFRNVVMAVWKGIQAAVSGVVNFFTGTVWPVMKAIFGFLVAAAKAYVSFYVSAWRLVSSVVRAAVGIIVSIITGFINTVRTIWNAFWSTFGGIIKAVFGLIVALIRLQMAIIGLIIRTGVAVVKAVWTAAWNFVKTYIIGTLRTIANIVRSVFSAIASVVSSAVSRIRSIVTTVWSVISSTTTRVWNTIRNAVSGPVRALVGIVSGPVGRVKSAVSSAWNTVTSATSRTWNGLRNIVSNGIGRVMSAVSGLKSRIVGFFSNAGSWLYSAGRRIIQGLIDGIKSLINRVTAMLNDLTEKIKNAKGPPEKDKVLLVSNGQQIMQSLIDGLQSYFPKVENLLNNFTPTISTSLASPGIAGLSLPSAGTGGGAVTNVVNNTYDVDVDAPQNMSPEEVATLTARKLAFTVSTGARRSR